MSTKRTTSGRRLPRWARLIASATGLLAMAAFAAPGTAEATPAATYSASQLAAASDAVLAADIGGTAWAVDPAAGTVRVSADETVSPSEIARLRQRAGSLADALTVERVPGRFTPYIQGGEAIYASGGWRCTLGFNVRVGTADYFVTAGHCTDGFPTWYADSSRTTTIGPTAGSSFPGNDYGLVRHSNTALPHPGTVNCNGAIIDIIGAINPTVGMTVWRAGTTGCRSGRVTAVNATVNYGGGDIVYGLIATNVCAEPGDSGGPLFSGQYAVGILSGGSGNCSSGGTTYYQPIIEVLNAYGAQIT